MFDFYVTEDQTRTAQVKQPKSTSAYGTVTKDTDEELEAIAITESIVS